MIREWWEQNIVFAVCSCQDGKHEQEYVYQIYRNENDAEGNREENEHIVVMRSYTKLEASQPIANERRG